ncbi:metallophosphoesterase family protein [Pirellulaceae bacterium SH467]
MLHRRLLLGAAPLTAFALSADCLLRAQELPSTSNNPAKGSGAVSTSPSSDSPSSASTVIASPPVVQHRTPTGFTVVFQVNALATGWVEWGTSPDQLDRRAIGQHHGLKTASDLALAIHVHHGSELADAPIYYRLHAVPLRVVDRNVEYGEEDIGTVHCLRAFPNNPNRIHIAVVNDTHENGKTIAKLCERIESYDPDWLIWNGDTCNDFHPGKDVASILLGPGKTGEKDGGGWASTRPLIFVPGNHDVRGRLAYQLQTCLPGWPCGSAGSTLHTPYCSLHRIGPMAMVTLDTGEDKPDAHPSFQGTAAYEPYRDQQAAWLANAVKQAEFKSAPYRLAICHIPLRGLPGHSDGMSMEGYAYYSGFGAKAWMPSLVDAKVQAIVSGHMHRARLDTAADGLPAQIVMGGPQWEIATLTRIVGDENSLAIIVENLDGVEIFRQELKPALG